MSHYESWRQEAEAKVSHFLSSYYQTTKNVQFDQEAVKPELKKTSEELFASKSEQYRNQFLMDKSSSLPRKLLDFSNISCSREQIR